MVVGGSGGFEVEESSLMRLLVGDKTRPFASLAESFCCDAEKSSDMVCCFGAIVLSLVLLESCLACFLFLSVEILSCMRLSDGEVCIEIGVSSLETVSISKRTC